MSSTYLSLNAHIIFSTKRRNLLIPRDRLNDFHAYIGGIIRALGAKPIQIGGIEDHMHLLIGFGADHSVASLVREIKKRSNVWISEFSPDFKWQVGYAAYTVSPERIKGVTRYIATQEEHHRELTFEEERLMLLKLAGVEFDPKYLD